MTKKTVFISYSHDSDEHREQVLWLSERLRVDGFEAQLDQYANGSPQEGWPRWMLNQLDAADAVLVVCTPTYYRRFRGHEEPGKGKGADWEGALITQEIYDSRSTTKKFLPVFLTNPDQTCIPEPLRAGTHYPVISDETYEQLCDALLDQAGVEPCPVGELKTRPRRQAQPMCFTPETVALKIDIGRIDKYAPAELIGREAETALLDAAWSKAQNSESARPHILGFVALGGEGKTSLVAKWAADLAHRGWPGCAAVFAWSFYSQGTRNEAAASSDLFLCEALAFFGDAEFAASAKGAHEKGARLARLLGEQRALLILDGLEPLQYPPTSPSPGELRDQGLAALLKGLAAFSHGLCVFTTRYAIPDLRTYRGKTVHEHELLRLSTQAGVRLLQILGVKGNLAEYETLVEDVKGHALTVNLLGSYLRDAHAGDIRRRDGIKFDEADAEEQGGHAFRVMDAYVESFENGGKTADDRAKGRRALALLQLLGLFDRPASADCLRALWRKPIVGMTEALEGINEAQRTILLKRLEDAKLITQSWDSAGTLLSLDAHPLIREYFGQRLRTQQPKAWHFAHRRLFEHLCATTLDKLEPTLEDLQPLYQAVAHGCLAGLQKQAFEKVYFDRIQRGPLAYSIKRLGAFSSDLAAIACFFENPWHCVSSELSDTDQSWLLSGAAYYLRALGRLSEALAPMQAGLELYVKEERWINAANCTGNLSELALTMGRVDGAVAYAERSVNYADYRDDEFQRLGMRAMLAAALHQAGRFAEAQALFGEAEWMQAQRQSTYPLLYSWQGFQYCELLLTQVERVAGRVDREIGMESKMADCRAVTERATRTLAWAESNNVAILDVAFDQLTLGRAALYVALFSRETSFDLATARLEHAVSGLRCAGRSDYLPSGLLSRAWLRSLTGPHTGPDSAQADLDEAWEIAERGPMPLFLADIHLYRARLFGSSAGAAYPWESPAVDLAAARQLIEKHGYWRRKEELEDAEAVCRQRDQVS